MNTKTQKMLELTDEELALLNGKMAMRYLFSDKKTDIAKALRLTKYEMDLRELQAELVLAQDWIIKNNKKLVVLFEGRDAAGKGGAIRRITAHINPRFIRIVALPKPTDEEQGQWYFQRYINNLPKPGEMVFFDRSWYNRAIVEPVNDFCTDKQYQTFIGQVNEFERMLQESDTYFLKIYFSITKKEQLRRFNDIKSSPLKKWKMTPIDEKAQDLWDDYTEYKLKMFEHTNTANAPWKVIEADKKTEARVNAVKYILDSLPYKDKSE